MKTWSLTPKKDVLIRVNAERKTWNKPESIAIEQEFLCPQQKEGKTYLDLKQTPRCFLSKYMFIRGKPEDCNSVCNHGESHLCPHMAKRNLVLQFSPFEKGSWEGYSKQSPWSFIKQVFVKKEESYFSCWVLPLSKSMRKAFWKHETGRGSSLPTLFNWTFCLLIYMEQLEDLKYAWISEYVCPFLKIQNFISLSFLGTLKIIILC